MTDSKTVGALGRFRTLMRYGYGLALGCLLAGSPVIVCAAGYAEAKDDLDRQQYEPAREAFRALAEAGDPRAMFYLAVIYDRGLGVPRNQEKARLWYERAAVNGHPEARFNLGNAFKHGLGGLRSENLATYWWQKAADQGLANAQYNLALQYYSGKGVEKDRARAYHYFHQAAGSGHERAKSLIRSGRIPEVSPPAGEDDPRSESNPLVSETRKVEVDRQVAKAKELPVMKAEWLDSRNPDHYVIQLAVMANRDYLEALLRDNELLERATVVEKHPDGKRRFLVLLGSYATKSDAVKALDSLSPTLRKLDPWIRSFADLASG